MKRIKNNLYIIWVSIATLLLSGCSEEFNNPLENNQAAPGTITNIRVENLPGKARLTYILPGDPDLLYVKAEYTLETGVVREIKNSYYTNTMMLDGFSTVSEFDVKVSAVNRSEIESDPTYIKVNPLENPIWDIFRSLKVEGDFSGVKITADNPEKADISIEIVKKDTLDNWEPFLPYIYTSAAKVSHITRGLDTIPQHFGLTIRDRFKNYTDTMYATITPLYEEMLSKSQFREMRLPGDAEIQTVTAGMPLIWNGDSDYRNYHRMLTATDDTDPQWITFDTGQLAQLSRVQIQNYGEEVGGNYIFYYRGQLRFFELWGSTDPDLDGSWDSWVQLGSYECVKPSGLPYGEQSAEDFDAGVTGFEFEISTDAPKIRYMRIKSLENWMGTTWFEIKEIDVFGDTRP